MPDEPIQPVGEKPTAQPEGEKPASSEKQTGQQPADFEAWLATQADDVKALYEAHTTGLKSALEKERKANKKRDEEEARKTKDAQDAQLSEADKINKRLAALQQERDALAAQVRLTQAREALAIAAEHDKIEFASAQAMRDAFEIALKAAEFDDDGKLQNPTALLKASIKDREYLLKKQAAPAPGDTNVAARGESSAPVMDEQTKLEFAAIYGIDPRYLPAQPVRK